MDIESAQELISQDQLERLRYLEAITDLVARDLTEVIWWKGRNDLPVAGINCGDTFYWACGDAEEILFEDIPRLTELLVEADAWNRARRPRKADDPYYNGDLVWLCEKREMRPITPIFESLTGPTLAHIEKWPARTHAGDECMFCQEAEEAGVEHDHGSDS